MEDKKTQVEKAINLYLRKMDKGLVKPIDLKKLAKDRLSDKEFYTIIVDHALTHDIENMTVKSQLYFNPTNLAELLKHDDTKEKVIKLLKKYQDVINLRSYILLTLVMSNYDLYFLISLEGFYDFTNFSYDTLRTIFTDITERKLWDDSRIKKFFIYFFNNPAYIETFKSEIMWAFTAMSETLQRFLAAKTELFKNHNIAIIRNLLNQDIPETVGELIMKNMGDWGDEDLDDIVKFYVNIDEKFRKFLFASERDFYIWLGDKENHNDVLYVLDNILVSERVNQFFRYNPNWAEYIDHEEGQVKLKYGISGVPDFVKDSIKLDMVEQAKFDGVDIQRMFYDHDDSPSVWVRYYVDDELWDHTIKWNYSPDESTIRDYYWDDINEENLNTIKEILKKENPEINLDDEDEVKDAAFENDEISSVLHSAASNGEKRGDEERLDKDIESGIDELFGKGNWKKVDDVLYATINLSEFDGEQIYDAYNDCGEWYIKCIFTTIRADYTDNFDKASLPDYRYGVQGDFDKDSFNQYIVDNL